MGKAACLRVLIKGRLELKSGRSDKPGSTSENFKRKHFSLISETEPGKNFVSLRTYYSERLLTHNHRTGKRWSQEPNSGLQIPKLLPFIGLDGHMFKSRGKDSKVDKGRETGREGGRREEEKEKTLKSIKGWW